LAVMEKFPYEWRKNNEREEIITFLLGLLLIPTILKKSETIDAQMYMIICSIICVPVLLIAILIRREQIRLEKKVKE
jgi:hypothetical protein